MSSARREYPVEAWPGGVWTAPDASRCRYIEVEAISGFGGLAVRWTGPVPGSGAGLTVSTYDGLVVFGTRARFDAGSEDRVRVSMIGLSQGVAGGGFTARVRTDVEPFTDEVENLGVYETFPVPGSVWSVSVDPSTTVTVAPAAPPSCTPYQPQWGPGVSADQTIIGGAAGQTIRLRYLSWQYVWQGGTGLNVLHLRDSSGVDIAVQRLDTTSGAVQTPAPMDFAGFALPVGSGLVAHIEGAPGLGVTIAVGGSLTYSQS